MEIAPPRVFPPPVLGESHSPSSASVPADVSLKRWLGVSVRTQLHQGAEAEVASPCINFLAVTAYCPAREPAQTIRYKNKFSSLRSAIIAAFKNPENHDGTVTVPPCKIDLDTPALIS